MTLKSWTLLIAGFLFLSACSSKPANTNSERTTASALGANNHAEELYNALEIKEKEDNRVDERGNPILGATVVMKSVGGLTCKKTTVVVPGAVPKYECSMASKANEEAIYRALRTEEVDTRPRDENGNTPLGAMSVGKSVGGLTCQKVTPVVPRAKSKYSCLFTF